MENPEHPLHETVLQQQKTKIGRLIMKQNFSFFVIFCKESIFALEHLHFLFLTAWGECPDGNKQSGLRIIFRADLPSIQDLYRSRVRKGWLKSLQTPHILHTNCLGFYLQVSATE
ncbi:hypothetical protein AMECASPLE_018630 [Ameca splendens]|uniref:Uncharacterized protein n=1 Tax=Ameca splendens TaxID=208324 RepID=A0ABV0ZCJ3_9TELE